MARTITFNELRAFKDKLPDGSIRKIAQDLNLEIETVRNYFVFNACVCKTQIMSNIAISGRKKQCSIVI